MKLNEIIIILNTMTYYNSVRITQTFTSEGKDMITAVCIPDTSVLELMFLDSSITERYDSAEEAAAVISDYLD